jgi:putative ABC transport system permease protein
MDTLLQDLRYGFRTLARQPGFTVVAVLTLAIGIGANTAIYSVVDATLLRTLPFRDPARLMKLSLVVPSRNGEPPNDDLVWSYPKYAFFRDQQQVFSGTALYRNMTFNLTGTDDPEQIHAEEVGGSYFQVLGVEPQAGRAFRPEEDVVPARDLVAVISHGLWERRFGADPQIAGKTIALDQRRFTIVGVAPAGFQALSGPADVWIPAHAIEDSDFTQTQSHSWECVARLKPGVSVDQARAAVATLGPAIDRNFTPRSGGSWGAKARTLAEARIDPSIRKSVLVLFGAVSFVLLIACVNVANLLLARGTVRQREIAIRLAVGAGRMRLVRQLLTESVVLSVMGAAASLALASIGVSALAAINPVAGNPFGRRVSGLTVLGLSSIRLDSNALLFTFSIALLTGILFGLAPALQSSRADVGSALKNSGARFSVAAAAGKSTLVIVEVALAMILLVGAGLMIKSFGRLLATRSGVDPENVLTMRVNLPSTPNDISAAVTFFTTLQQRVAALPGVVASSLSNCYPLAGGCSATIAMFPDRPPVARGSEPLIGVPLASPDYLRTMKVPLLRGRWFTSADRGDAPKVVVINETAARRFWPGEDPIGKRLSLGFNGFSDGAEVIGIAGDVRYQQLDIPPRPDAWVNYLQSPRFNMVLSARTIGNPAALTPLVERELHALNKDLPAWDIKTMNDRIRDSTARTRFSAILLAVFAFIALALAGVGIYGVMSYLVTQRTREIGIRVALGAGRSDVLGLVLRRGAALALAGIAIGVGGALAATRVLSTMLYEVKPADLDTYIGIGVVLAVVAMAATYVPARRATAVDAATALRSE